MELRRIADRLYPAALFRAAERARAALRHPERRGRFERIAARRRRDRLFLVGNGPSLGALDLDRLAGEDYVLVNMAEHLAWGRDRAHPYYLAADLDVFGKYAGARPGVAAAVYFFSEGFEGLLDPAFRAEAECFFFAPARGGVMRRGLTPEPWVSVADGQSVLIAAAQIGWALGYRALCVIGCDLDYSGPDPYAYRTTAVEQARARRDDAKMVARVNAQFARLRADVERRGGAIVNAGVGGRLDSLPRADFAALAGPQERAGA